MSNLIKENFNEKIAIILQEQWTKQCQTEEFKSMQELKKKEQYYKETWVSISKPKHGGGDRDPNKQKKYIQD